MTDTSISAELINAYETTAYRVIDSDGVFVLRVGDVSDDLARMFERTGTSGATFITAENPFSKETSSEENEANQARLRRDLEAMGATIFKGAGQGEDPKWPAEASFLAIDLLREQAIELGNRYQQNAILWAGADARPELLLLR